MCILELDRVQGISLQLFTHFFIFFFPWGIICLLRPGNDTNWYRVQSIVHVFHVSLRLHILSLLYDWDSKVGDLRLFLDVFLYTMSKTDLVVETWWFDDWCACCILRIDIWNFIRAIVPTRLFSYIFYVIWWLIFKYDHLMSDHSLQYFLLLLLLHRHSWVRFMHLVLATILTSGLLLKQLVNIKLLTTTLILKDKSSWALVRILGLHRSFMTRAIPHFSYLKEFLTFATLEDVEVWPHLPINLLPWYPVTLPYVSNELFKVPLPI